MNKKIESHHDELQPELAPPIKRQAMGTMFNIQPNGGVHAALPVGIPIVILFATDDSE
jgi:hypothetical protein